MLQLLNWISSSEEDTSVPDQLLSSLDSFCEGHHFFLNRKFEKKRKDFVIVWATGMYLNNMYPKIISLDLKLE